MSMRIEGSTSEAHSGMLAARLSEHNWRILSATGSRRPASGYFSRVSKGSPFQPPFPLKRERLPRFRHRVDPPGKELSSATVKVLWGFAKLALADLFICQVGLFDLRIGGDVVAVGLGLVLLALFCAVHFGRLYGGDLAERT